MISVRAIWSSMTWKRLLAVQALGFSLAMMRWIENWDTSPPMYRIMSRFVIMACGALFLLPATLCADEAVKHGALPRRAYAIAVLIACAFTALAQWLIRLAFGPDGLPFDLRQSRIIPDLFDVAIFGALAVLMYVNRRTADRILEGIRSVELRRVQTERQLIEARLATSQAQIDPQMLFESLAQIRADFGKAGPDAEARLDGLILKLRRALAGAILASGRDGAKK